VARLLVDVQLEVLVLVHEAPSRLVDGKVVLILLLQEQVRVVAVRELRLCLDGLVRNLLADGVRVRVLAVDAALSHPRLHHTRGRRKVVVDDFKVAEAGESVVAGQGAVHYVLDLLGVDRQAVADVKANRAGDLNTK
jgi:hypothetical protein